MADLPKTGKMADGIHDIVRCFSFWLVDDQGTVKWRRLRLFWHEVAELQIGRRFVLLHLFQEPFNTFDVFLREIQGEMQFWQPA